MKQPRRLSAPIALAAILLTATQAIAQQQPSSPQKRLRIGLALGGGGAVGLSEIGVLRWFEENHIPVDAVAGSSMGALVGALYSTGRTPDQMEELTTDKVFSRVFRFSTDYKALNFRRREERRADPSAVTVGLNKGISFRSGLLTDSGLNTFLITQFLPYGTETSFDRLPIPFRCLATDIAASKEVTFSDGNLAESIRASISIPGVFSPVEKDGHVFVDAGILENLPTQIVKNDLHADVVIAVSLPLPKLEKKDASSAISVLQRSFSVAIWDNELRSRKLADVVIEPQTAAVSTADYQQAGKIAKLGYEAAEAQRAALLKYRLNDADWAAYKAAIANRQRGTPRNIAAIHVTAPTPEIQHGVEHMLAPLQNTPLQFNRIDSSLDDIRSDERFQAEYALSSTSAADQANQTTPAQNPDTTDVTQHSTNTPPPAPAAADLNVLVRNKPYGPPFLLLASNIVGQSGGVVRATLNGTLIWQDLGGFHSEWRTYMRFGFETSLSTEYYRRLTPGGFFIAPHLDFLRTPVNIYRNQRRLSQRLSQSAGGGVDLGYSLDRHSELRLGWQDSVQRWKPDIGSDPLPTVSGTAQLASARYTYDGQDRPLVPQHGLRASLDAGYLYHTVQSSNAPRLLANFAYATPAGRRNTLLFAAEGGTYLNRAVAEPFRFTLGGPMRLSASALQEYRGTDYFLVRPAYLRRLASLPEPLGQSLYILTAYEAGQMRSPDGPTLTRQDAFFGIAAETPLGVLTVGPAIGDAGRRKLIFTLGKFF